MQSIQLFMSLTTQFLGKLIPVRAPQKYTLNGILKIYSKSIHHGLISAYVPSNRKDYFFNNQKEISGGDGHHDEAPKQRIWGKNMRNQ